MKTYAPKPRDIERRWYVIDAQGSVLGRLASETAKILRGKDKPTFAPHADTGDHVVIVNARGVELTGGKETKKIAYRHSGYPGGLTETDYGRLMRERPSFVVEKAVKGMLPKNRLGRQMVKKLQVYDGPEHPHAAQQPTTLKLGELPQWNGLPKVEPPKPKPEPKKAPAKSTAKATTAKPTTAKRTTAKSPAKKPSTAKRTGAKRTTANTTAKTTAKSPAKKPSTAKRTTTRKKKEGDE